MNNRDRNIRYREIYKKYIAYSIYLYHGRDT